MSIIHIDHRVAEDLAPLKTATAAVLKRVVELTIAGLGSADAEEAAGRVGEALGGGRGGGKAFLALGRIVLDGQRLRATEKDLRVSLMEGAGFGEEAAGVIAGTFEAHRSTLAEHVARAGSTTREYVDLDWRLDVEVGSRHRDDGALHPSYLLRLDTRPSASASTSDTASAATSSLYLSADYATLARAQAELEAAAAEVAAGHASRVMRYMRH